jgi:hypothetical protein
MFYFKDTSNNVYTLNGHATFKNDIDSYSYHIPYSAQNFAISLGSKLQEITVTGFIQNRTDLPFDKITQISFDNWASRQYVYIIQGPDFDTVPDGFYIPFKMTLIVSPLRIGSTYTSNIVWGWSSVNVPSAIGSGFIRVNYQGPTRYWPLQGSLSSVDGIGITFDRTVAETYKGVSYSAGTPIYDGGLVLDTSNRASASITAKSLVMRLLSVRYPSMWVAGGTTPNILTANQSSGETDTTGTAATNGTITRVTSTSYVGGASFLNTVAASGDSFLTLTGISVTAGKPYCFSTYIKATAATNRQWKLRIEFFNSSSASLGYVDSPVSAVSSSWTQLWVAGVAPTNSATCKVSAILISAVASEKLYMDGSMLEMMTLTQYLWQSTHNSCYIDVANGVIKWTDGTNTISKTFDWQKYTQGKTLDVIVIDDTTDTLAIVQDGTTSSATGTLSNLTWGTLNIGSDSSGNELMAAISNIVVYPYALTIDEYSNLHLTTAPLTWGNLFISYKSSGTISINFDGRLLDANGNDITACISGTIPTGMPTLSMSDGLSARWSVSVDDTWERI